LGTGRDGRREDERFHGAINSQSERRFRASSHRRKIRRQLSRNPIPIDTRACSDSDETTG
jgi:hypothetical protein